MHLADYLGGNQAVALYILDCLTAAECMRLGLSCVRMYAMVLKKGVLFGPVHRSVPFITGLSPARHGSYYLDIMQTFFGTSKTHRIRTLYQVQHGLYMEAGDYAFRNIVFSNWDAFTTSAGRAQIQWAAEQLLDEMRMIHSIVARDRIIALLERLIQITSTAFCVQNRTLVPGKFEYETRFPMQIPCFASTLESDGSDSDSNDDA